MSARAVLGTMAAAVMMTVAGPVMADDTGFAYMHDLRKEGGRTCFTDHWHYGSGNGATKAAAQKDAVGSWASFTAFEYGSDWARFSKAVSKRMSCSGAAGSRP